MKAQVLTNITSTWLPLTAFMIFFIFFIGLLFWIFRSQTKAACLSAEQLPLSEGEKYE